MHNVEPNTPPTGEKQSPAAGTVPRMTTDTPAVSRWAPAGSMECGAASDEVPGYGHAYCELRPGHDGPHREREDGHVWE